MLTEKFAISQSPTFILFLNFSFGKVSQKICCGAHWKLSIPWFKKDL